MGGFSFYLDASSKVPPLLYLWILALFFGMYKGPFHATFEGFVVLLNRSISLSYVLFLNHGVMNHKQMLSFAKVGFNFRIGSKPGVSPGVSGFFGLRR